MTREKSSFFNFTLALCGMGAAGKARRLATQGVEGLQVVAEVSRRPGVGNQSWAEVLADPGIDAVAISTENTAHARQVEQALQAGKHVLCDYPLALEGSRARGLFRLAQARGKILHVEHIALLSEEHLALKAEVRAAGPLVKGEFLFQGGWNEKLADPDYSGPYPFLAVSRLLQIADLFGAFQIAEARQEGSAQGYSLHLHLQFPGGGRLGFTEERRVGLPRRRSLMAECERASVALKAGTLGGGLFAKDLAWFRDRIRGEKNCYYDEGLMLGILDQLTII
ncbi:MAG: Gfo/Idh/MocA family oxidoreductase [bacterium]